jgi:HSP20 family protein
MANILRYNPTDETFDDLFRSFFMRPVRFERQQQDLQIKVDVIEDDKAYTVHAEIPGVKKEGIHVTIDGGQLAISAEIKNEKEVREGPRLLRNERYYGKVSRSFSLGQDVDENAAEAKYDSGVLELRLPKRTTSKTKTLSIK